MKLQKYSMGVGDRFSKQAEAQLAAIIQARELGIMISPVCNKSFREHEIIASDPAATRSAADSATQRLKWDQDYFVDADHINRENVEFFLNSSDFFTLDVADHIGKRSNDLEVIEFIQWFKPYREMLRSLNISEFAELDDSRVLQVTNRYLSAIKQAKHIYSFIESKKGVVILSRKSLWMKLMTLSHPLSYS